MFDQNEYTVNYSYHVNGQRASITVKDPDAAEIYHVSYGYDAASRLDAVHDATLGDDDWVASYQYDKNGNRSYMYFHLDGTTGTAGNTYIEYEYNIDNRLIEFDTHNGPTFSFDATTSGDIDGMGRLVNAIEEITDTEIAQNTVTYNYANVYDRLSRLTSAKQTLDITIPVATQYVHTYSDAGNMTKKRYNTFVDGVFDTSSDVDFSYQSGSDLVTGDNLNNSVTWDNNARQTSQLSNPAANYKLEYDYEGRLREGWAGSANDKMIAKYTPGGARVYKERIWSSDTSDYKHKYIVDVAGKLPKILVVLDADDNDAVIKKYIHARDQVIAQHDISYDEQTPPNVTDNFYFYLHDRLGSVRQIIDTDGDVVNAYTYDPWGLPIESETADTIGKETKENISNLYLFANYIYDAEIKMYYCNAREYDPILARFTSRDPVLGTFENPMTLHAYLYCVNDPINNWDPSGEIVWARALRGAAIGLTTAAIIYGMHYAYTTALRPLLQMMGASWMEDRYYSIAAIRLNELSNRVGQNNPALARKLRLAANKISGESRELNVKITDGSGGYHFIRDDTIFLSEEFLPSSEDPGYALALGIFGEFQHTRAGGSLRDEDGSANLEFQEVKDYILMALSCFFLIWRIFSLVARPFFC